MHLIIDGYGSDAAILGSEEFIFKLLDEYPAQIGMTKISAPHVIKYTGGKPEEWGVSGFVFIAESHIAVHTFPERGYINMDIFSCKDFDATRAVEGLSARLKLGEKRTYLLDRGEMVPARPVKGSRA